MMVSYEQQGTAYDPGANGYERQGRSVEPRIGDWIQTFTGRAVYPMDLRPEDIDIHDIAHALSMQCRYAGHCLWFYSVAEHSVLVARAIMAEGYAPIVAMAGLLHDATEAYLTDVPRPVKPFLVGYKEAEDRAWRAIAERYGLSPEGLPIAVKEADNRILFDEKAQNMGPGPEWSFSLDPLGVELKFWTPGQAESEFLAEFDHLIYRLGEV